MKELVNDEGNVILFLKNVTAIFALLKDTLHFSFFDMEGLRADDVRKSY